MVGWCDYWAVLGARQQGGYFGSAANLCLGLGNAARSVITFDVWRVPTPADCVHGYTVTWPLVLSCSPLRWWRSKQTPKYILVTSQKRRERVIKSTITL